MANLNEKGKIRKEFSRFQDFKISRFQDFKIRKIKKKI